MDIIRTAVPSDAPALLEIYAPYILSDLLFKGILISSFLHVIAIGIIHLLNFTISFNLLYDILSGRDIYASDSYLLSYFLEFTWYNILISLIAWIMAKGFKSWVRRGNYRK